MNNGFGSSLLVKSGATASNSNLSGTYDHTTNVTLQNGAILQSGTSVNWNGSMVVEGDLTLKIDQTGAAVMTFPNAVSIPGNLVSNGAASGGNTSFLGHLNVTGTITMTTGNLSFDGSSGTLSAASIALSGGTVTVNFNRSSDMAFGNVISGTGGVRQTGTGTTTLNGNNTDSGATSVTAGTLLVNVTQTGTGAVTVSSGATLRASGKMSGAVTITGTVAPGTSRIGMLESGQIGATPRTTTINGTLQIDTDGSAGTPTDVLNAAGALTLGAASTLDFNSIGTPLTAASYVIASDAGTLTGTFGTVTDLPPGYSLVYNFNNGVTSTNIALVKTASPYGLWIDTYFPGQTNPAIIGAAADPDGDGESNALEFALGGSSNNGSSRARVHPLTLDSDDGGTDKELLLTIAVRVGTPAFTGSPSPAATHEGFTSTVQGSLGLAIFSAPVSVVTTVTTGLPAAPAGHEYRTFRLDGSDGLPSKGFLPVQISLNTVRDGIPVKHSNVKVAKDGTFGFYLQPEYEGFYTVGERGDAARLYLSPGRNVELTMDGETYSVAADDRENTPLSKWAKILWDLKKCNQMRGNFTYQQVFPILPALEKAKDGLLASTAGGDSRFDRLFPKLVEAEFEYELYHFLYMPRTVHPKPDDHPEIYQRISSAPRFTDDTVMHFDFGMDIVSVYCMYQ